MAATKDFYTIIPSLLIYFPLGNIFVTKLRQSLSLVTLYHKRNFPHTFSAENVFVNKIKQSLILVILYHNGSFYEYHKSSFSQVFL